ncbi:uncharacterized protein JN550_007247 [Neoarthrinium moseri]|uniref:uncharacterized protein n=1 Tax=Neoarthrinium moseri TaxID=1658444 RepID=UPI001FDBF09C|nr:uncharacterized protein JN550_007247 [Neoarthrinium moseri]KAI1867195.1 hypothetical protein JN550_007247 [Neoarthrinium moseri]
MTSPALFTRSHVLKGRVFLILREHLGDENLDLAGGVLYELIEIDCEHTHDPGAAFQRWRHDHMGRYHDLELPHVPHMTTITSSIIPTAKLARWRLEHSERYSFVLSDSSPVEERLSLEGSCIRNRKSWLIDNTFYVSSRNIGTFPMRVPNPQEFHEMHWSAQDGQAGSIGKSFDEKMIEVPPLHQRSRFTPPGSATTRSTASVDQDFRESLPRSSLLNKIVDRLSKGRNEEELEQWRRSSLCTARFESSTVAVDESSLSENTTVPLPDGCEIPNAIFARKHRLVDEGQSLPTDVFLRQMTTAESKATDTVVEAANSGSHFRGPFTPQLGYDGGLDYRWTLCELSQSRSSESKLERAKTGRTRRQSVADEGGAGTETHAPETDSHARAKRRSFHFGLDSAFEWLSSHHSRASVEAAAPVTPERTASLPKSSRLLSSPSRSSAADPSVFSSKVQTSARRRWRNTLLFENVEFIVPADEKGRGRNKKEQNRKTTIMQVTPPTLPALRGLPSIADGLAYPN